ncbi:SOUL heme-binding protein [Parasponia andersonii]|uniref:SOUL heme-binding protein n=1 Tax=Parasponia andersonii TaxID=3476 RepID=A0A2P5B7Y1_PARAD|nr:SOUL heme-binding protein [Parasponia andersonii]
MYFVVVAIVYLSIIHNLIVPSSTARSIESPQYTVVYTESDFEVRLYKECSWMSALVQGTTSFENSTKDGFHRLYQYIHGANLNSTKIPLSAPVLTSIINASSSHGLDYYVMIYQSPKYERASLQPLPELNLQLNKWKSHCIAIRKFSGFAKDDNIDKEVESLRNSLNKHLSSNNMSSNGTVPITVDKNSSYTIAQYNSSRHLTGRLNEVWINVVLGFTAEGCLPYQEE